VPEVGSCDSLGHGLEPKDSFPEFALRHLDIPGSLAQSFGCGDALGARGGRGLTLPAAGAAFRPAKFDAGPRTGLASITRLCGNGTAESNLLGNGSIVASNWARRPGGTGFLRKLSSLIAFVIF
jgi:hypothetical protein